MILTIGTIVTLLSYLCAAFEALLVIFFWTQIARRNETYASVYYVVLSVGYAASFTYSLAWLLDDFLKEYAKAFDYIAYFIDWYFLFFCGFWNFIVGLYRCTALGWPVRHRRLWSKKQPIAVIAVLIFPFIANFQSFLNPYCKIHIYDGDCDPEMIDFFFWLIIINSILSFSTLLAVIIAVFTIRASQSSQKTFTKPFERKLILQTILSTIFQLLYYLFSTGNNIFYIFDDDTSFVLQISFFILQHYSSILVLFVICHRFRRDLLNFYGLKFLAKRTEISQTLVVQIFPSSNKGFK